MAQLINEAKRMQQLAGLINESQLNEVAGEDLELKSAAKQIFSVLKKYGLKPEYEVDGKQFTSKDPHQSGYGARVHINNGIMTVAVYDRGIWQTIQRKQKTNELDMGNVSSPTEEEKQQINQIAGKIYNDIVSALGKDKFELKSQPKPNEYGDYIIQIRKKSTNPNQRPNAPKPATPAAQPQQESIEQTVNEALRRLRESEKETSSDLTPEQVAAVNDIFSISEGDENASDDDKFEKLTAKIQKYASKGILTAALVATLVSMASCSGSKGMTNCNYIKAKMSGYRE